MNKSELPPDSKPESKPDSNSDNNRELPVNNQENVDQTPKEKEHEPEFEFETTDGKVVKESVFDKYVETHSPYEAYRHFKIINAKEPTKPVALSKAVDAKESFSASVDLDVRRTAIEGMMAFFNLQNKYRGANSDEGRKNIEGHNPDVEALYRNMYKKEEAASKDFEKHFNTLATVDELKKAGFSEDEIQSMVDAFRAKLENNYGPGNAYVSDREKLVKKVQPPQTKRVAKKKRS